VEWEGHAWYHDKKVLSLFSASNYHGELSNFGAICVLDEHMNPTIEQYKARDSSLKPFGASEGSRAQHVAKLEKRAVLALAPVICGAKATLNEGFSRVDVTMCGYVSRVLWKGVLNIVLKLGLPWLALSPLLVYEEVDYRRNQVAYVKFLESYRVSHHDDEKLDGLLQYVLQKLLSLAHSGGQGEDNVFSLFDQDGDGNITYLELKASIRKVIPDLPSSVIYTLMRTLDVDRNNQISADEFSARFGPIYKGIQGKSHPEWALTLLKRIGTEMFKRYATSAKAFDALFSGCRPSMSVGPGLNYSVFAQKMCVLLNEEEVAENQEAKTKELEALAKYIDKDGDGKISVSEFLGAFEVVDLGTEDARERLDAEIRSEVGACVHKHRAPLRAAFKLFDPTGTGRVSLEDFKIAMECLNDVTGGNGGVREAHALHLGGAAEKDTDGMVNYNEWLDGFISAPVPRSAQA